MGGMSTRKKMQVSDACYQISGFLHFNFDLKKKILQQPWAIKSIYQPVFLHAYKTAVLKSLAYETWADQCCSPHHSPMPPLAGGPFY